jgi:hypothetical protein
MPIGFAFGRRVIPIFLINGWGSQLSGELAVCIAKGSGESMIIRDSSYIGGQWCRAGGSETFEIPRPPRSPQAEARARGLREIRTLLLEARDDQTLPETISATEAAELGIGRADAELAARVDALVRAPISGNEARAWSARRSGAPQVSGVEHEPITRRFCCRAGAQRDR